MAIIGLITITISADIKRPKFNCERGFGLCNVSVEVEFGLRAALIVDETEGVAEMEFLSMPKTCGEDRYIVDENVSLPQKAANCLGFESAQILRGEYVFDTCISQFGTVRGLRMEFGKRLRSAE